MATTSDPPRRLRRGQLVLFFTVLLGAAGCDHASKQLAHAALADGPALSFIADAIRFELAFNPGAFLSIGAELPGWLRSLILQGLAPLALLVVCVAVLRSGLVSGTSLVGLGLVAGGGVANWTDRLLHGGNVTDFVSLGWGGLRTGIFNLADVAVVAGVVLLMVASARAPAPVAATASASAGSPSGSGSRVGPGGADGDPGGD